MIMAIPASAEMRMTTTGGTSCKSSSGLGAILFYFSNTNAENTSSGGQYLTCQIPGLSASGAFTPNRIEVVFGNPAGVATQATCAIQSGYDLFPSSTLVKTAILNVAIPANGFGILDGSSSSTPILPTSTSGYIPYTLTCLVPAANKLGLIAVRLPGVIGAEP